MLFRWNTPSLALFLVVIVGGGAALGTAIGRRLRQRPADHASVGVVQAALLGLVGLLLAFGLTMAVNRYDTRRALVVQESNAIGTTFLRAQLLSEPSRSTSLALLSDYVDAAIDLADQVPDSAEFAVAVDRVGELQRSLWSRAGEAVGADPTGTAPRLYVETLNTMIDTHNDRLTSLRNRVPGTVVALQVLGSTIAVAALALYLSVLGRGLTTSLVAGIVVILMLFISLDLDRPHRGLIRVPDGPLVSLRRTMDEPPAVTTP